MKKRFSEYDNTIEMKGENNINYSENYSIEMIDNKFNPLSEMKIIFYDILKPDATESDKNTFLNMIEGKFTQILLHELFTFEYEIINLFNRCSIQFTIRFYNTEKNVYTNIILALFNNLLYNKMYDSGIYNELEKSLMSIPYFCILKDNHDDIQVDRVNYTPIVNKIVNNIFKEEYEFVRNVQYDNFHEELIMYILLNHGGYGLLIDDINNLYKPLIIHRNNKYYYCKTHIMEDYIKNFIDENIKNESNNTFKSLTMTKLLINMMKRKDTFTTIVSDGFIFNRDNVENLFKPTLKDLFFDKNYIEVWEICAYKIINGEIFLTVEEATNNIKTE